VKFNFFIRLAVYIISNLELIVRSFSIVKEHKKAYISYGGVPLFQISHNRSNIQPGENEWGFGQIIAVVLTLGIFIDIVAAIRNLKKKDHTPPSQSSPPAEGSPPPKSTGN